MEIASADTAAKLLQTGDNLLIRGSGDGASAPELPMQSRDREGGIAAFQSTRAADFSGTWVDRRGFEPKGALPYGR